MDDLTPQERQLITDGITIAGSVGGIALALAGIPGAGPFLVGVGNLLFNGFAPAKSPEQSYYEALSRQIAQLETALIGKLNEIGQQIQHLGTSLSNLINELGLQIDLTVYDNAQNVINQYYSDLIDFLQEVSNPATIKQGAQDLYNLFNRHADDVAIQMQNLHDTVVGIEGTKGLLTRQLDIVSRAVQDWVKNPKNYDGGHFKFQRTEAFTAYNYVLIFTEAYNAAASGVIHDSITPILRALLTLQYRGLTFLVTAWGGSVRTDQLQTHINNAKNIIQAIDHLISTLSNPELVNATVSEALAGITFKSIGFDALTGHGENYFDLDGYTYWDTEPLQCIKFRGPVIFGAYYDSVSLHPTPSGPPFYGYLIAKPAKTLVPSPGSRIANPLSKDLSQISTTLQGTLIALTGPQILLGSVPSAQGGILAGQVTGLNRPESFTVSCFEVTETAWQLQAHDVPVASDGSFHATLSASGALFWGVVVTKPGWQWAGAQQHTAPSAGPDILAFLTVPVSIGVTAR